MMATRILLKCLPPKHVILRRLYMQGGGVIEKTHFQWLSRCMSSIQYIQLAIASLPTTFHWADNFLFDFGWGNTG